MEELIQTYEKILERRAEDIEIQAKLQGVEIKKSPQGMDKMSSEKITRFNERLRERTGRTAGDTKKNSFSDGVGYQVIGG